MELYLPGRGKKMGKKLKCLYCVVVPLMVLMMSGSMAAQAVFAETDIEIVREDYDALPVNHVEIGELKFEDGELSGSSDDFCAKEFYDSISTNISERNCIAYYGKVNWGTSNTTESADAKMSKTDIPGSFTLRFADKATLSDGSKADVLFEFSDWEVWLGAKPDTVKDSDKVYIIILKPNENGDIMLTTGMPRTDAGEEDALQTTIKQKIKVTAKIVESGTDKSIDEKFDNMLMGFVDLDVHDNSIASGKTDKERYEGEYAESIELVSGYSSPLLTASEATTKVDIETANGNVKIHGNAGDEDTLDSGFVCPVAPQGYSYYWYGSHNYNKAVKGLSCMGTKLAQLDKVSVGASAGTGGSIEKEGSTSYALNSTTSYTYAPKNGYHESPIPNPQSPVIPKIYYKLNK